MVDVNRCLSFDVPCDNGAPKTVRDALRATHDGGWSLEDGLLVASELVTNAVTHSGGRGSDQLHVEIDRSTECLLISVHDPGLSGEVAEPQRLKRSEDSAPGGWGLALIERLSLRWGTERPDGYRVWAELAVDLPGASP